MQQLEIIAGFSDLKSLLIKTYNLDRPREDVRLHFTESNDSLLMHDYQDHSLIVHICFNIYDSSLNERLTFRSKRLAKESLSHSDPAGFLNEKFLLYGTFRF